MKIYHTETQEDYDALMVELEAEECEWLSGRKPTETTNNWKQSSSETCVKVNEKMITFEEKRYYTLRYPGVSITKYKVKADEKMKFTKENVLNLTDKWMQNKISSFQVLQNEIKKLEDTPEKVVVPKCFDEWFKEIVVEYPMTDSAKRFALWKLSQQGFGQGFEDARGKKISYETELGRWLLKNKELAIDAVLNGYIVEPEQLYYIPLPHLETSDGTKQVLSKRKGYKNYFAHYPTESLQQEYTKAELEQVPEIYKLFAVPVKEEEE